MSLLLLTPDRNDRAVLLDHLRWQVSRFTVPHDGHIIVNYPATSERPDLKDRLRKGYVVAKGAGADWVTILENDDFYPANYIEKISKYFDTVDFIGSEFTYYYNLKNKSWERSMHPNHSSLFCTSFRVSAMDNFKWSLAHNVFIDLDIWKYARKNNYRRAFIDTGAIGIKGHGYGLAGGKGHKMSFVNKDPDSLWLAGRTGDSFEFYKNLELK